MSNAVGRPLLLVLALLAGFALVGGFLVTNSGLFTPPSPSPDPIPELPKEPEEKLPVVSNPDPRADSLRATLEAHLLKFEAKNIRAQSNGLLADYLDSRNTTVEWTRLAGIYTGNYRGYSTIIVLYSQVLGNTVSINITMSDYKATIEGDKATTTMRLVNVGEGKLIGEFQMEIDVLIQWLYRDGRWLITDEVWEFLVFKTEEVAQGTVFPLHWRQRGDYNVWDRLMRSSMVP